MVDLDRLCIEQDSHHSPLKRLSRISLQNMDQVNVVLKPPLSSLEVKQEVGVPLCDWLGQ